MSTVSIGAGMRYLDFLHHLHLHLEPRTYVEIGVRHGRSLALTRAKTVAVDPRFEVRYPVACDLELVQATSDDYFSRPDALKHLDGQPVDLSLIDGMHLFEYALRDLINLERHSHAAGVIVVDDMLPPSEPDADRQRHRGFWTGDVYKLLPTLHRHRPDLAVVPIRTEPTGLALVLGLDPTNTALTDNYGTILYEYAVDDPQQVPQAILDRSCTLAPERVLDSGLPTRLAELRRSASKRFGRRVTPARVAAEVASMLGLDDLPRLGDWVPDRAHVRSGSEDATATSDAADRAATSDVVSSGPDQSPSIGMPL